MSNYPYAYRRRSETRSDALPEQVSYQDTGCEASPSCLACPLPQCKYDDPAWYQQYRRQGRDQLILDAYTNERATVFQLAERFQLSPRTIHRALHRSRMPLAMSA